MMKKFVLALIVSLCLVVPVKVNAMELEKSFETSFDVEENSLRPTIINSYDDLGNVDGYIVFDFYDDYFAKYDLDNKLIYKKDNSVVNDLKVDSTSRDLIISRIDTKTEEVIWQDKFGGNGYEDYHKIFYDYDASGNVTGYLLEIYTESTDLDVLPGDYIIKYDIDGNLLWIKPYHTTKSESSGYAKNNAGDLFRFASYHTDHGLMSLQITNVTKNTTLLDYTLNADSSYAEFLWSDEYVIFIWYDTGDLNTMFKYGYDGKKVLEKELKSTISPTMLVNSKTIAGDLDGFISIDVYNSKISKFDYDGNLIWEEKLSYRPKCITESYDASGKFNGFIVVGADDDKKVYITNFTYPKKTIESKNSDVEVATGAYPGRVVTVKAKEKTGYVVKRIVVKDSSGEEIEVSSDGTFVMPDDDVSIEVIYEKKAENIITNPKTSSALCVALAIISISLLGTFIVKNKKMRGENL